MLRKLVPFAFKRKIRLIQRQLKDRKTGMHAQFATRNTENLLALNKKIIEIEQPIYYNPLSANKVVNIRLAISEIEKLVILPGQIFSFWAVLGNPTPEKGYQSGRNIIGDRLQEDVGGGLCQVSGMLYHLGLIGGLEIIERHCHTIDLYAEDKRYTPLGADATVVYGYKDLRLKNSTNHPICFRFDVSETEFIGRMLSESALPTYSIRFERQEFDKKREIKTYRGVNSQEEFINLSVYRLVNT